MAPWLMEKCAMRPHLKPLLLICCALTLTLSACGSDTAATGSGSHDSGTTDAAAADAGDTTLAQDTSTATDTGAADSGAADSGAADSGAADTGAADTGTADTGAADTGTADIGLDVGAATDTGMDAADVSADVGVDTAADTGLLDTGTADTGTADTGMADTGTTASTCGDGTYEPPAEQCDDGNACSNDGCVASQCVREQSTVLTSLQLGGNGVGFDLDNADGDNDIHTGVDNALGSNSLLANQLNSTLNTSINDGSILELITLTSLDDFANDPDVTMSLYGGVDPSCPPSPSPVPWTDPNNAPVDLYSDADTFNMCQPPVLIDDSNDAQNGVANGTLHMHADSLAIPAASLGNLALANATMEAHVDNDGTDVTKLSSGVMGGILPAKLLYQIDTSGTIIGSNCPTALHAVLGLIGQPDQDVDGGGIDTIDFSAGSLPCIASPVTINGCYDDGGTYIAGAACANDPRIGDGYSVGLTFEALQTHVVSQVSGQNYCP